MARREDELLFDKSVNGSSTACRGAEIMNVTRVIGLLLIAVPLAAQQGAPRTQSTVPAFRNDRLKVFFLSGPPLLRTTTLALDAVASGLWLPESNNPHKALIRPMQVTVTCNRPLKQCEEISAVLEPVPGSVTLAEVDQTVYEVSQWDEHGLTASYGGDESNRCQRRVLTIDFDSGAVSVSDVPTRKAGCEAFTETDSYKLVRGHYFVDTTPRNNFQGDEGIPTTKK